MKPFTIRQAAAAVGGVYHGGPPPEETPLAGVAIDHRKTGKGFLFVPIRGERFDGHDFIDPAFAAGALCCLSERPVYGKSYILVESTAAALRDLAEFYRGLFDVKVVGVTGSAGKTTVKELTAGVLSQAFRTLRTEGNLNNQTGVPQTVFRLEERHEAAVIEMGTNHFGEIAALAKAVRPDICLLTNIGTAHMEHLGSRRGILKAKCEMLDYMRPDGTVIVNGDDPLLAGLKRERGDVTTYGVRPGSDVYAAEIRYLGLRGAAFTIRHPGGGFKARVLAPGEHMVSNAAAAAAAGLACGLDGPRIARGLLSYAPSGGRMRIAKSAYRGGVIVLDDCYNANPQSVLSALDVLARTGGRRVCILGDMFELGEDAARYHAETGALAARRADLVICVGELSRHTRAGAGADAVWYPSQRELAGDLDRLILPGDTVLVKASRGMRLEDTVARLMGEAL
jgi:UDP-N-acetylmuramoyl-tripeptide--D-alanyl-D-alanine ligase